MKRFGLSIVLSSLALIYIVNVGYPSTDPAFGWDNAEYLVLAKSLATGQGFRLIYEPDRPFSPYYPIGYPLFLAIFLRALPNPSINALTVTFLCYVSCLVSTLAVWLSYLILRYHVPNQTSLVCIILLGLTPMWVSFSGSLWSEPLFTVCVLAAILCATIASHNGTESWKRFNAYLWPASGLFAGLALLTRTAGVALVVGVFIYLLHRETGKKTAQFAMSAMLTASPFYLWKTLSSPPTGYLAWIKQHYSWSVPLVNLKHLTEYFAVFLFPPLGSANGKQLLQSVYLSSLPVMIGCALAFACVIGLFSLYQKKDVVAYFLTCYLIMVVFYPWEPDRFLVPVNALLLIAVLTGGRCCFDLRGSKVAPFRLITAIAVVGCLTGSLLINTVRVRNSYLHGHPGGQEQAKKWKEFQESLAWIKQNTPQDAVIITTLAASTYLFTDRQTIQVRPTVRTIDEALTNTNQAKPIYLFAYDTITIDGQISSESLVPLNEWLANPVNSDKVRLAWKSRHSQNVIYQYSH